MEERLTMLMHAHRDVYWFDQRPFPPGGVYWRPSTMPWLHYDELYRGLPEYVRLAPDVMRRADAAAYLLSLRPGAAWTKNTLQRHRIIWVRLWIAACNDDKDNASDADTVDTSRD
jgi:hypothetical protein